jgi:type I restriction enzyme R subunit
MPPDANGKIRHEPFHSYTMKQAIEEGFILDVLKSYTPVGSYYKLVKKTEDDPEFDTKKAKKKLRRYVESHDYAIRLKAEIMVDHFHEQVLAAGKIGGQARAMVVASGVERAIQYFLAFKAYLVDSKSRYEAIVAFSGEYEYDGSKVSEASLNGFPGKEIAERIQQDPYRFLICADKFQTGYDEPLLHTMYVDKPLAGIKAVQTLSRLNRAHPQKHDCFVLDFQNNSEAIVFAFQDYYRTTLLADETDPNKLHDLKLALDAAQVYSPEQIQQLVELFLGGADRDELDPILDACVVVYKESLDENGQVDFKGKAKAFCRTYSFLSSIIPYSNAEWEKLSIVLNLLTPKLPAPQEEDFAKGILEAIDMDSYRVETKAAMRIALADEDAEIGPAPTPSDYRISEPYIDRLSAILRTFNDQFGTLFTDTDRVAKRIRDDIAPKVAADAAYRNARENTPHTARLAHDQALGRVMQHLLKDDTQVYKQFVENASFKRFVTDMVFALTTDGDAAFRSSRSAGLSSKLRSLAEQLRASGDPRDLAAADMLLVLEHRARITLADALAVATERGLSEADALAAVERLARPATAGLDRFYVHRSKGGAQLLEPKEVRERLVRDVENKTQRNQWMSSVEVVWAGSKEAALRAGGSA